MRYACAAIAGFLIACAAGAHAQVASVQAQTDARIQLAAAPGKSYDIVANCLMRQLSSGTHRAWPLVYAPPRHEALVNLWLRGREYEPPVAVFHVVEGDGGLTRVSYELREGARGPGKAAAEAAARQCLK